MRIEDGAAGAGEPPALAAHPLRIAFLSYRSDPRVGGQGVFVRHVSAALARRGHRVTVVSGPPYPDLAQGVELVRLPSLDLFAQPYLGRLALRPRHLRSWTDLREFFGHHSGRFMEPSTFGARAARYLRAHRDRYDVVLDNQTLADGLLDVAAAGLPVTAIIHHPIHQDRDVAVAAEAQCGRRALVRRWYSFLPMQERVTARLDSIVTVSRAAAADIVARLGARPGAVTVVHPGYDRTSFRLQPDVDRLPWRIVSTASADVPLKGLRYLLDAFAQVAPRLPRAELVVVGRGRAAADQVAGLGLGERIRFVHGLDTPALAALYASAAVYVAPSLYEGFGLPVAEAMACGTPVLVTDGGALPEVAGDAGLVVPRGDATALADGLATLLLDPARRAEMSLKGLARARAHFSWDRLAVEYERILTAQMGARRC